MSKTVLVSGGAGFIGSHVTVELSQAGYDVVIADNMSNCDETNYKGVCAILGKQLPFEKMDFCDAAAVDALFNKYRIDAVIHFAAYKAVGESVAEPLKYYKNNLGSFLNVLEASRAHGTHVLFSSSATVYGEPEKTPVTEESPRQEATSPYGNTKQMCEDFLRDCVRAYGIHGIALRYFNPIGAHPSALIGELPRGVPNNLVPYITQTAAGKRECLSIFGNDYPTEDGTCLRDYIDGRAVRDFQHRHRQARVRARTGKGVREGQRPETQLQDSSAPGRRRDCNLGRPYACREETRLESDPQRRGHPRLRLGLGETYCRQKLIVEQALQITPDV